MIESPLLDRILAQHVRQTKQAILLDLLGRRFGDLPEGLEVKVRSVDDDWLLSELNCLAAISPNLDDFTIAWNGLADLQPHYIQKVQN